MKVFEKMSNGKVLIKYLNGTVIGSYFPDKEVLRHPQGNALIITDSSFPQKEERGLVIYYEDVVQESCSPVINVNNIDELIVELGASFFFEEVGESGSGGTTSNARKMVLIDDYEYTYIAIHNHSAGINGDPLNPENGDLAMNGRMPDGRLAYLRKYNNGIWSVEDDNII